MTWQIYSSLSLSQAQTIFVVILSILGFAWFFFLSSAVKFRTSNHLKDTVGVPILKTIVPTTITDILKVVNILRMKMITPIAVTSVMVVLGLVLTSFEGIIVLQTISYVESCDTTTVKAQAQIPNEVHRAAYGASAEVKAMMDKRRKSEVPSGTLVGQIPIDDRWKYDANLDVDPYTWKSSCSLYKSGVTQVNMNNSILYEGKPLDLRELLPEVHAEYTFYNSPDGYNHTKDRDYYKKFVYYNETDIDGIRANGALILFIEEFTRGDFHTIGMNYMNRLWTMRVPETTRIPYDPDNEEITEVTSVPIAVKAYTCEMERVKKGDHGSYNVLNQEINAFLLVVGELVSGRWYNAVLNGEDSSIHELTPEHWASYLAVKDTQTAQIEEVLAQINIPCIMVHSAYILLVCVYILMLIIGTYCAIIRWKKHRKYKIPGRIIDWVSFVSEDSNYTIHKIKLVKSTDVKEPRINDGYNLGITADKILKIKLIKNLDAQSSLLDYNFRFSSNNNLKIQFKN